MTTIVNNYLRRLIAIGGVGSLVLLASLAFLNTAAAFGLLAGYLLSFLFVASNFMVVRKIELDDQKRFLTLFFVTLTVRFVLVLIGFALILAYVKIDQILFTVSFIISYIFHSVIEIIFINEILENRPID